MEQKPHDQACSEFAAHARRLIEEFQRSLEQLFLQHCLTHASSHNEETPEAYNDMASNAGLDQGNRRRTSLDCPECQLHFDRRNNLGRHWPRHVRCEEKCLFCHVKSSTVHHYTSHFNKCQKKLDYPLVSDEMTHTLQQQDKWKKEASKILDGLLASRGKGSKKRQHGRGQELIRNKVRLLGRQKTLGTSNADVSGANNPSNAELQAPSSMRAGPHFMESQLYSINKQLGAFDSDNLLQEPVDALLNTPKALQEEETNNPDLPSFGAVYTVDQAIDPAMLQQPALAFSYTTSQSIGLSAPSRPNFSSVYEAPHLRTSHFSHLADTAANSIPQTAQPTDNAFGKPSHYLLRNLNDTQGHCLGDASEL